MGKQNYEFNGQTMHRKWSDQNHRKSSVQNTDRSVTKDSAEATLPSKPPTNECQSTPAKNATASSAKQSTVLPIITVNDCNSFNLKKFDLETSQNYHNQNSRVKNTVHVDKEIVVTP